MKKFALLLTIASLGFAQMSLASGVACNHRAKLKMLDGSTVAKKFVAKSENNKSNTSKKSVR